MQFPAQFEQDSDDSWYLIPTHELSEFHSLLNERDDAVWESQTEYDDLLDEFSSRYKDYKCDDPSKWTILDAIEKLGEQNGSNKTV